MTQDLVRDWLARIGVTGRPAPSFETLALLIRRQLQTIPFENVDAFCGRVPQLEPKALHTKLIEQRRGGYCFELNSIMALGLTGLGFDVTHRLARVLWQRPAPGPWTHHVLHVSFGDRTFLVDVGFGGPGPDRPVPLAPGPNDIAQGDLRLAPAPGLGTVLFRRNTLAEWTPLYAFGTDVVGPGDLDCANWLAATYPGSIFGKSLMAALGDSASRVTLADRQLRRWEAAREIKRLDLTTVDDVVGALGSEFGLAISSADHAILCTRLGSQDPASKHKFDGSKTRP